MVRVGLITIIERTIERAVTAVRSVTIHMDKPEDDPDNPKDLPEKSPEAKTRNCLEQLATAKCRMHCKGPETHPRQTKK